MDRCGQCPGTQADQLMEGEHERQSEDLDDGDNCLSWCASRSYGDGAIAPARHDAGRRERASSATVKMMKDMTQEMTTMTEPGSLYLAQV